MVVGKPFCERREHYASLEKLSDVLSYVRQCLSALGTSCTQLRAGSDGFTLHLDASKTNTTGLCLVVHDDNLDARLKDSTIRPASSASCALPNLPGGKVVTNNYRRLCHTKSLSPHEDFLEINLDALLAESDLSPFMIFYRFFGGDAFAACVPANPKEIGLDNNQEASDKRAEAVERHLKGRVEPILELLCRGFVVDEASALYNREMLDEIYRNAIYLLYRILFLFYAEARALLPVGEVQYQPVSLASLVESARLRQQEGMGGSDTYGMWKHLTRLCVVVDDGDEALGVAAYNGGLFSDSEKPYLKNQKISDQYLAPALYQLGYEITKSGANRIDYRDLSVRHLGTLYEGLLEFKLNLVSEEPVVVRDSNGKRTFIPQSKAGVIKKGEVILDVGEVYFADDKGERKNSGSYYTPEDVVQYIVTNTVTPKLLELRAPLDKVLTDVERERQVAASDDQRTRAEAYGDQRTLEVVEKEILRLRILDPAMGSGHFLVAAGQIVTNFIIETLNQTDWPNSGISTDPLFWKRRVVERCLYGVDKNPLSQELAKLSLWIASASAGKPLTFLDHHLKVGNSLYGAPFARIATLPTPKKPVNDGLFGELRERTIRSVLEEIGKITETDSEHIEDVKYKGEAHRNAYEVTNRLRDVANVWLASLFGLKADNGAPIMDAEYDKLLDDVTHSYAPDAWETRVEGSRALQSARRIAEEQAFFHWELEFPDSVVCGESRFDAVVANPPYVGTKPDKAITVLFETAKCGDLYGWIFERAMQVASNTGNIGIVVPLSLMFSRQMNVVRKILLQINGDVRFANFNNNPDTVFPTTPGSRNSQRATVATIQKNGSKCRILSSDLLRWSRSERHRLFESIQYADVTELSSEAEFPKLGSPELAVFYERMHAQPRSLRHIITDIASEPSAAWSARYFLTLQRTAGKFISHVPE